MKVFLSSTVEGLRDARLSFIERIERICQGRVTLVCYERDGHRHPTLSPEETCLQLVRECNVLVILADQYYGTPCNSIPGISITHAEVREALKLKLTVIPVVRTQTWHEYKVWRANRGRSLRFPRVREPRLFEILDELYSRCNCHVYDNLTGDEALTEIAAALDAVISQGSPGAIQHVALPVEPGVVPAATPASHLAEVPLFVAGEVLYADDLNALYRAVVDLAATRGLSISPSVTWRNGQMLTASELNALLEDVERIYRYVRQDIPQWSFGRFQDGRVLHSFHLNEIAQRLRELSRA